MVYAVLLFGLTYTIYSLADIKLAPMPPLKGNIISFLTMTLPVFLYFYLLESSKQKATLGKRKLKIYVESQKGKRGIFIRTLFKIIPWEIAHIGIHWSVFYSEKGIEIPLWNWLILIIPQVIIIIYFITVVISKGRSSLYDKIAKTSVEKT
tara:strand:+ start:5184 stop:5636 length:453 start_codon:yes stop_codon:yes gene_type:complete